MSERKLRALDLFCCAGGSSMGLHRAGFEVVGVDIDPQPHYPFEFHQADAMTFPLDGFDFIWASPPCQAYTLCQRIRNREHPELIEPTRSRLKANAKPWCIENVVGAPLIDPIELCGAMFGLRTYRHRLFECSFPITAPPHPEHTAPVAKMGRPVRDGEFIHVVGNFSGVKSAREAMGIDWMPRDKLREAIPPAYAEYIGLAAIKHIRNARPTPARIEVPAMHDLEKREIARRLRQQAHELFMMAKQLDPPDERADKPVKKPKGYDVNTIDWVEEMLEAEGADQA